MAGDGKLSDIVWERHPSLYAAAQQTYLTNDDATNINKYAWLVKKHDELTELPIRQRTKAFNSLEGDVQNLLKYYFETDYSVEEKPESALGKIFGQIKSGITSLNPIKGAFAAAEGYSRGLGSAYIQAAEQGKYSWSEAFDGERIFDEEEEAKMRSILSPEVFNIAKRSAMGDSPGEILADLQTEAEFDAFERWRSGDPEFKDAVQQLKNSKVSFGRDFARNIFNLKTDDGLLFTLTSGSADLFYQIVSDPLTYVTGGFGKGLQLGGVGLVRGSRAISRLLEGSKSIDEAFAKGGVRSYWDRAGALIKDLDGGDAQTVAAARTTIQRLFPEIDNAEFIKLLREDKIYDAASAKKFFEGAEKLEYLLKGKVRADRAVMPVWGWGKQLRSTTNTAIDKVFYKSDAAAPALKTMADWEDELIKSGEGFKTPKELEEAPEVVRLAKERRGVLEKFARAFEKAPVVAGIRILQKEVKDPDTGEVKVIDEFVQSSDDIYKLARTVFSRREANVVRAAFEQADTSKRYSMLRGLYVQIGQSMGLNDTVEGRNFLSKVMTKQFDNSYTEAVQLTDDAVDNIAKQFPDLADAIRLNNNYWEPTKTADGVANAAVHWQVAGQIAVPRFDIWSRQVRGTKAAGARFLGGAVDSRFHDEISQAWTLLTLFPRNGMRGAIDEMITFGLTAPLTSILSWGKGRALSRAYRMVQDPEKKNLLIYQRFLRNTVLKKYDLTEADYIKILDDPTGTEFNKTLLRQYGKESSLRFWNKFDGDDARFIEEGINTGAFVDNLQYVQGSTTKGFKNSNPSVSLRDENVIGQKALIQFNANKVLEDMRKQGGLVQKKSGMGGGLYSTKPEMTALVHGQENVFRFQWKEQMFMRAMQDPVAARIFLENLDNPANAIKLIGEHLAKDQSIANRLKMRAVDPNVDSIADAAVNHFMHLRAVFFGADGKPIEGIRKNLNNILVKDKNKTKLNLEWLENNLDNVIDDTPFDVAPRELLANVYEYAGISKNAGEVTSKMADGMWGIMDNQTSMMFREPAYFANYLSTRKQLKGAEQAMERRLINNGTDPAMAKELAATHYANLSGKLAMERTIAYIDNPLVRTNTAFMVRNFARFFRATEDFYRRYGRAFKNDPQSIMRLRLATLGLSGSGFIHQTEEGEDYFVIPGDSWMWTVSSSIWKSLTGNDLLAVNPVEFGVKIQMISPSLDPDSALPSFAGPLAAVPIKAVSALLGTETFSEVPGSGTVKRTFDKYSLGVYSENSSVFGAMMPGSVRKMLNALTPGERNSQFASAAMQATLYAASNPNIKTPGPDATFAEKQEFLAAIRTTTANLLFLRNMLGLVSPAGISAMETKDVPEYIKEAGFTSMSREFYKMREEMNLGGGEASWSEALLKWTYNEKNAGRLIYTVARTERTGPGEVAKIQTTKEAADWVAGNPKLVKKYPIAAMFFAPQMGEFDIGAYSYLKLNGYIKNKALDQFLTDINLVEEKRRYFQIGRLYEERILSTADATTKSVLRDQMESIRRDMRISNPELDRDLSDYSFSNAKQLEAIEELDSLLKSGLVASNPMSKRLALMLERYRNNRIAYTYAMTNGLSSDKRRMINTGGLGELESIAGNDKNLLLALDSLFAPILER
jgi:hypothetical protein